MNLPDADRLLVVLSDLELGAGGLLDDYPDDPFLGALIRSFNAAPYDALAVDLVLNGDTFDLLKTPYRGEHPRHITADVAVGKLVRVVAAHPIFFEALRAFLSHPRAARRVHFVVGNHDPELFFPAVQTTLRALLGHDETIRFPGLSLDIGDVHIEHGQQGDPLFRMEADKPFVDHGGTPILNLPFASVALLDVAMPLQALLCFHDRVKPRDAVFALLPEVWEVLSARYWSYWTRDYWRGWFSDADPVKRVSWTLLREVASRFGSRNADSTIDASWQRSLLLDTNHRLSLVGHTHEASWSTLADRKVLVTGTFRHEFTIDADGVPATQLPKVYAEAWLKQGRVVRSYLVEADGPPPPAGWVPASIFAVRAELQRLLGTDAQRKEEEEAREAQEAREARPPRG